MMKHVHIFVIMAFAMLITRFAYTADYQVLSESAADKAALEYSGGGIITRRVLRNHDGRGVYQYVIVHDGNRIKIRVDAEDGSMITFRRTPVDQSEQEPDTRTEERILSHEQAKEIALERSGGGVVVEAERDYKRDGRVLYEIEIHKGDMEYEMVVDGHSGRIVKYEEERRR